MNTMKLAGAGVVGLLALAVASMPAAGPPITGPPIVVEAVSDPPPCVEAVEPPQLQSQDRGRAGADSRRDHRLQNDLLGRPRAY